MTGTELRAVPWAPVAGGLAVGSAALLTDLWLVTGGPGSALLWLALAGFAASAAFLLDEPSAVVVDAAPTTRAVRTARRLMFAGLPLAGWLAGAALVVRAEPALSWPALAVTGGGFLAVTLGVSACLRRAGHATPGDMVAAGALGAVVLALVVGAVPKIGPVLQDADATSRSSVLWAALVAVATGLGLWGAADPLTRWRLPGPARRSPHRQPGSVTAGRPASGGGRGRGTRPRRCRAAGWW